MKSLVAPATEFHVNLKNILKEMSRQRRSACFQKNFRLLEYIWALTTLARKIVMRILVIEDERHMAELLRQAGIYRRIRGSLRRTPG